MVSTLLGLRCSNFALAIEGGHALRVTFLLPPFSRRFQLLISGLEDLLVPALPLGLRRDVADGAVQPHLVVVVDIPSHYPPRIIQGQRRLDAEAVPLEGAVKAFDLAVALRIVRRRLDVRHAAHANELLEVLGHELQAVVGDDPRRHAHELFPGPLEDLFDFLLFHRLPDFPVDDEAAAAVEDATEVIKRAADVEVRHIDVPVFVDTERLLEAGALLGRLGVVPVQQATT